MEATVMARALQSNTDTERGTESAPATVQLKCGEVRSLSLLRAAIVAMVFTLILLPGGLNALQHTGTGWQISSISRYLVVPVILSQLLCCWIPLARRYFKRGECHDIPAFIIATAALFVQVFVGYALFADR